MSVRARWSALGGRFGWVAVCATGLTVAIAVAAAVAQLAAGYRGIGDYGAIAVRSLDVGTPNTPLLGTRSSVAPDASIGIMHHPGPMQFFVLAPWVRLLGDHGLPLAGALMTIVTVLLLVWVCTRAWGRDGATASSLSALTLVLSLGVGDAVSVWPPVAIILPLAAVFVAAWLVITGDAVGWWVLIAAGSFVAQSNLASAPNVAVALVAAMAAAAVRRDRIRPIVGPALLGLLLWIPPIIEQLTDDHPNLNAIWHSTRTPADTVGWARSIRTVGVLLSSPAGWSGRSYDRPWVPGAAFAFEPPHTPPAWPLLIVGAALVACAAIGLLLTRRRNAVLGVVACSVLVCFAIAEFARAPFTDNVVSAGWMRWMWSIAVVIWIGAGVALLRLSAARAPKHSWPGIAAVSILAAAALLPLPHAINGLSDQLSITRTSAAAVNRLESAAVHASRSYRSVLIKIDAVSSGALPVLIMAIESTGATVYTEYLGLGADAPNAAIFGDERPMDPPPGVKPDSIPVLTVRAVGNLRKPFASTGTEIVGATFASTPDAIELNRLNSTPSHQQARREQLLQTTKGVAGAPIVMTLTEPSGT